VLSFVALAALLAIASGYFIAQGRTTLLFLTLLVLPGIVTARWPFFGLLLVLMLVPLEEFTVMGGGSTLIRFYGVPVAGAWLASIILQRREVYKPPGFTLLVALVLWDAMSLTWTVDPWNTAQRLVTEIQLVVLYLMCVDLVRSKKEAHALIVLFISTALLGAVVALQRLSDPNSTRISLTDPTGSGANQFAHLMALSAAMSIAGAIHLRNRLRWISFVASMAFVLALFVSLSKSAIVALAAAVVSLAVFGRGKVITGATRQRLLWYTAILLVAGWFVTLHFHLLPDYMLHRLSLEFVIESEGSGRLDYWRVGLQMVKDRPLTGVGLDSYPRVYLDYALRTPNVFRKLYAGLDAHSDYLRRLTELGIPGFLLFGGFLYTVFCTAIRASKLSSVDRFLWSTSFGMLVVILVSSFSTTYQWRKRYWIVLALVAVVHRLATDKDPSSQPKD